MSNSTSEIPTSTTKEIIDGAGVAGNNITGGNVSIVSSTTVTTRSSLNGRTPTKIGKSVKSSNSPSNSGSGSGSDGSSGGGGGNNQRQLYRHNLVNQLGVVNIWGPPNVKPKTYGRHNANTGGSAAISNSYQKNSGSYIDTSMSNQPTGAATRNVITNETTLDPSNNSNNITTPTQCPHSSSSFSLNKNEEFHFVKPPECPVFRPTDEEFKNPLAYISKIRAVAEKFGIAKIKPPRSWTPPFTVDVDKLKFTPRVQRLNELEAKTRIKLNFLDQIAKFWELQGSSLKIPMVERKALDLHSLHRVVHREGGIDQVTKERKWSKVAHRMGYPQGKSIGAILKNHYERILHPFDIYTSGKVIDIKLETEKDDKDYKPHGIVSRQQISPPNETTARRSKRFANSNASKESACGLGSASLTINHEIKLENVEKVDKVGPHDGKAIGMTETLLTSSIATSEGCSGSIYGGKMGMSGRNSGRSRMAGGNFHGCTSSTPPKYKVKEVDPLAKYICHICNRGDAEEAMLLCDGCDDSYHTFCLLPPLSDIPKGDWRCPRCVVEEVNKPTEAFGFEQAQREYTLQQFGEMADQFKIDYFKTPVHIVPTDLVEREFWRIVSSIDEDVTVEYGADLHTMDHGSGFPTRSSMYLLPGDQEYAESSWNLNNLPLLEESILGHINADISGMKVPWMYVGMCFATFCWHNEDHWSYSINYLHWGEPKTWYGVPGNKAEQFEETMKSTAPELFAAQPDLLHQLVTIMNPNILMKNQVPVYRTDQHAGEFVITFPRAYHAGFNQGYNFAEAVNFAPADWMKMGRECINHYSMLRRFCVFSHDELVCKMALDPDKLNLGIATACYLDMAEMVDSEKKLRKTLLDWGVTKADREAFELIPDDERQCEVCKTTCFLSAVSCPCTKSIVCLRHYADLCDCQAERHHLMYRYTLDELPLMLRKLKVKAENFESWFSRVREVLDPNLPTTITLEQLQKLAQEAEQKKFPRSVLLERLNSAVLEAEKCVTVIQQLDINKMRIRTRHSNESAKYRLTMDELELFVKEIDNLCCIIQEGQSVRELQSLGQGFVDLSRKILMQPIRKNNAEELEELIIDGSSLCIELHELKSLRERLQQVNWFHKVRKFRNSEEKLPLIDIQKLLSEGLDVCKDNVIEKEIVTLQQTITVMNRWEEYAKKCFESGTQHELPEIEELLEKAADIKGELAMEPTLRDAVQKAKEWLQTVEILQANEHYPYFHTLENVVTRGKNIPFQLEELARMQSHLDAAREWKEKTANEFLKLNSSFSLLEVLSPRSQAVMLGNEFKSKPFEEQFIENMNPTQMVDAFKNAEEKELREIRELRKVNSLKNPLEDVYCVCKQKFCGMMFNCQLCQNWFHDTCVPGPSETVFSHLSNLNIPPTDGSPFVPQLDCREKDRESKYLCPSCMRSRRPRLEAILALLVSLQKLPIRLPEGEALQCLTERAMNWQDRCRQAFSSEDVVSALAALSAISQKTSAHVDKNILKKKNITLRNNRRRRRVDGNIDAMPLSKTSVGQESDALSSSSDDVESRPLQIDEEMCEIPDDCIDDTFTAPEETSSQDSTLNNCKAESDMPLIYLHPSTVETLEELMMEGDLLELALDETLHLWRILNAAKPSMSDLSYIQFRYNIPNTTTTKENLVSNILRKRRVTELGKKPRVLAEKVKRGRKMKITPKEETLSPTRRDEMFLERLSPLSTVTTNCKYPLILPSQTLSTSQSSNMLSTSLASLPNSSVLTPLTLSATLSVNPVTSIISTTVSNSNITSNLGKKRKRATHLSGGKKSQNHLQHEPVTTVLTSDDDEECSALNCHRPSGREVDWVQCDGGCNKWFHMYCVGLDKNEIKADDDYYCKLCTKAAYNPVIESTKASRRSENNISSLNVVENTETSVGTSNSNSCIDGSVVETIDSASSVGESSYNNTIVTESTGGAFNLSSVDNTSTLTIETSEPDKLSNLTITSASSGSAKITIPKSGLTSDAS